MFFWSHTDLIYSKCSVYTEPDEVSVPLYSDQVLILEYLPVPDTDVSAYVCSISLMKSAVTSREVLFPYEQTDISRW